MSEPTENIELVGTLPADVATEKENETSVSQQIEEPKVVDDINISKTTTATSANAANQIIFTDMKLATILLMFASLWYFINTCITARYRFSSIIQSQAKVTQITIDFIMSIFNLIAVSLLMHLSWFDGWKAIHVQLENYDPHKEWFWNRYFVGNKLMIAMWLIWLPNIICFWFTCWALYEFNTSGIPVSVYNYSSTIVAQLAGSLGTCWLSFFWVYSTFPELMRKNKTYGSVTFGYYFSVIGSIYLGVTGWAFSDKDQFEPPVYDAHGIALKSVATDDTASSLGCCRTLLTDCMNPWEATGKYFQRPLFGSDFSTGAFIFFIASFVGILFSAVEYDNYQPSVQYGIGLTVTAIYFVGSIFLYIASYPQNMQQNDYVGSTEARDFFLWLFRGCRAEPKYEIITASPDKTTAAGGNDENAKF